MGKKSDGRGMKEVKSSEFDEEMFKDQVDLLILDLNMYVYVCMCRY